MIARLGIRRFKGFKAVDLELGQLTVLTGLNSAGKTSTVQALLLLRQALRGDAVVALNGPDGLALGEPLDVLHRGSGAETIELTLETTGPTEPSRVVLALPEERAMHLQVREGASAAPSALTQPEPAFTYLCAERHGPRDTLTAHATDVETLGVGVFGEHTAQVLALQERFAVDSGRHAPQDKHIGALRFLTRQTELWLSRILGTAGSLRIEARWIEGTTVTTLRFQMPGQQAEWTRPQNVGFGVSYALPIVVAGLRAPKGGLLVVENPEAHLHPAGQSVMGAFLAQVAASGVQVVVETHSDHVINGVRRAVAERAVTLDPDAVAVLYFRPDAPGGHDRIQLRETGELSAWPAGFFDQLEQDLGAIARARRGSRRR